MTQKLKAIPSCPGYLASDTGVIYRVKASGDLKRISQRLSSTKNGIRYLLVNVSIGTKRKTFLAHRLICIAFHGQPPSSKHQTRHLDCDPTNNRINNLCWGLPKENAQDSVKLGRYKDCGAPLGNKNRAILTEKEVRSIRKLLGLRVRVSKLANLFGVTANTISSVKHRKTWRCC